MVGGHRLDSSSQQTFVLDTTELYDPATGTWAPMTSQLRTASARGHTATLLPKGQVLVAGGFDEVGALASAQIYDPATGTWTATGSLIGGRGIHTATLLPNGKVLVAGGLGVSGALASAQVYDPATGTWTATGLADRRSHLPHRHAASEWQSVGHRGAHCGLWCSFLPARRSTTRATATSTAIVSSPNPAAVRSPITLTATVSPTPTGGTVSFTDNAAPITACQSQPLAGASATCTLSYASAGAHTIVATYSGTDGFASSVSAGLSEIVTSTQCQHALRLQPG